MLEATKYTVIPEDECVFSKLVKGSNVDLCVYADDMIIYDALYMRNYTSRIANEHGGQNEFCTLREKLVFHIC